VGAGWADTNLEQVKNADCHDVLLSDAGSLPRGLPVLRVGRPSPSGSQPVLYVSVSCFVPADCSASGHQAS
jgi:hypothetical protein